MKCQACNDPATLHITLARDRKCLDEWHLCEHHGREALAAPTSPGRRATRAGGSDAFFAPQTGVQTAPRLATDLGRKPGEVEMDPVRLVISEVHDQQVVLLEEKGGGRRFYVVIGIFEATAIDRALKGLAAPRPLTHDAWAATITALGGTVLSACVSELRDMTYHTTLRVLQGTEVVDVDVRPSDGFMVALKTGAPILVPERLLAEVCEQT